jgi:hypothetical protein
LRVSASVARGALARAGKDSTIAVELSGASDELVADAVSAATPRLWEGWAGHIAYVSEPIALPDRVVVTIDAGFVSQKQRRAVVLSLTQLVGDELDGVHVVVDVPRSGASPAPMIPPSRAISAAIGTNTGPSASRTAVSASSIQNSVPVKSKITPFGRSVMGCSLSRWSLSVVCAKVGAWRLSSR